MSAEQHIMPGSPPFEERRQAPRVDLEGRYTIRIDRCDGSEPMECPILDFSVTGIRVELPKGVDVPNEICVLVGEIVHNARVVWRNNRTVGIDLTDEHDGIIA